VRLDHLLSKEHQYFFPRAHIGEIDTVGIGLVPVPVVGVWPVHDKQFGRQRGRWLVGDHQTHYWALRQQARYLVVPRVGHRG
jgi:hypothetical protein